MPALAPPRAGTQARVLHAWGSPVFQADFDGAEHNPVLRTLILDAEKTDPDAALFGGINAIKSSANLLQWEHPSIGWVRERIRDAVTALMTTELGDAAAQVTQPVQAEAWAVVYRSGGSLRPHIHHDSAWSGVYYVDAGTPGGPGAGRLQLLDPRPGAVAVGASDGARTVTPRPGRMVAFPGWLYHSVQATAADDSLRIAIAWNVAYAEEGDGTL